MEILFYILVGIGLLVIFGKALLGVIIGIGGLIGLLVPIAVICAIIYIIGILI